MNALNTVCWEALVADAATMGFHWVYDQAKIENWGGEVPKFFDPEASSPFYTRSAELESTFVHAGKKPGDMTQYGEQLLVIIKALAKNERKLIHTE